MPRMIERCPLVTDEEENMTIDEIEEIYDAAKVTPEQTSEILRIPFDEIDFEDEQMTWMDRWVEELDRREKNA